MWRRLPDNIIHERTALIEKQKKSLPRWAQALIAFAVYVAALAGILYLNSIAQKTEFSFSLQNASVTTLVAVFAATAAFMYFLMIKSRKPPVIFICYSCEEAFHVAAACPVCNSADVSDIRLAEWIED